MMSVHTSAYRDLCNISLATSESDLANTQYNSPAIDLISHDFTPGFTMSGPLPLPSFVFPAKASSHVITSSPLSLPNGSSRQPQLLLTPQSDKSINTSPIPQLVSPSSPSPDTSCESPPISPRTTSSRSGFHKRGTSEYIGGDLSTSTASLPLKLSPRLDAMALANPAGSIIARRGHAHRRSAAISSGDLSIVLKSKISPRVGGSLPNTPNYDRESPSQIKSLSAIPLIRIDGETLSDEISPLSKSPRNTRVGFSDDVQIIPRPLSLASYDSASTTRHGHSVSNSLSSVVSASTNNNNDNTTYIKEEKLKDSTLPGRPRTAEPTLENNDSKTIRHGPKRSDSLPILTDNVIGSPTDLPTPRSLKRWTFFGNEVNNLGLVSKPRPLSATSSCDDSQEMDTDKNLCTKDQVPTNSPQLQEISVPRRTSVSKKSTKKQKKVKYWAGSILSNKSKQRSHKQKLRLNSPSLPKLITTSFDDEAEEAVNKTPLNPKPETKTSYANWKPREFQSQDEPISPVIDLDAALGPFNTPTSSYGEALDNNLRGGTRKRAMHSAAGLCGFSGPGMHYHRRTESAPEFENPRFGFHRLGSSTKMTMEDVFEEDEDEESGNTNFYVNHVNDKLSGSDNDSDSDSGSDSRADISANTSNLSSPNQLSANYNSEFLFKNIDHFCDEEFHSMRLPNSDDHTLSQKVPSIKEILAVPSEVSDDYVIEEESKIQASTLTSYENLERDDLSSSEIQSSSLHLSLPTPESFYATSQTSLSSPSSPFLHESQFVSKAQSHRINDHEFESLLLGGPGPEMRISVDDVPSLLSSDSTSGESTATGENILSSNNSRVRFRDGQRSASFSATTVNRKRSSIISLSRLINSSHGERSKLAIDSCSPSYSEEDIQQKSGNLGKRISRIMKFWKKPDATS